MKNTYVKQSNVVVFMETLASNFSTKCLSEGESDLLMRIFKTKRFIVVHKDNK
jgi:curli biogenesis system outer membrane secretion channel CsgG